MAFLADCHSWDAESGRTQYDVLVNDDRHEIYSYDLDGEVDIWSMSHQRPIAIINALFTRAGSEEMAFGAASGNDSGVYILTNALFEYIRQLPIDPVCIPFRAADVEDLDTG